MQKKDAYGFERVSSENPCPICDKNDWCLVAKDGSAAICPRTREDAHKDLGDAGYLHLLNDERHSTETDTKRVKDQANEMNRRRIFKTANEAAKFMLKCIRKDYPKATFAKRWPYKDRDGRVIFWVQRFDLGETDPETDKPRKKCIPISRQPNGWIIGDQKYPFPLYNLQGILRADKVVITEGEKAAEAMVKVGIPATTLHQFGRPEKTDLTPLRNKFVFIAPDNDDRGELHLIKILNALHEVGCRDIRLLRLPNLPLKGDAVEFVAQYDSSTKACREILQLMQKAKAIDPTEFAGHLRLISLSDVEPEDVHWLWPNRIPLGKLTVIVGDPCVGKSFLTLDVAARVSTGAPWPDCPGRQPVRSVILLSAEDDPGDTIRPRLDAMEGNPEKVSFVASVVECTARSRDAKKERLFSLARDVEKLEAAIKACPDCGVVIIDPISAYMAGKDSYKDAEIREVLAPLAAVAAKYGVAVIGVTHMNKKSSLDAIYRTMGSIGIVAAARAVWMVLKDSRDTSRRLMLPVKNNLANDSGNGLAFCIIDGAVVWEDEPVEMTAQDALNKSVTDDPDSVSVVDEIAEWLQELMAEGPMLATEVKDAAKQMGYNWRTVTKAKKEAGVVSKRSGFGRGSQNYWVRRGEEEMVQKLPKSREEKAK